MGENAGTKMLTPFVANRPMRSKQTRPGSLRIIAGHLRGSRLAVPAMDGLRPTPDRVRETLFNWLAPHIAGARCLDLFAGTGALGVEALSRGAAQCCFVERDRALAQALRENLARLRVDNAQVVEADALAWLARPGAAFDIVFIDPPFAQGLWNAALAQLEAGAWLRDGAFVHVEAPLDAALSVPRNWSVHREGHAGNERYALYRRVAVDPLS